MIVVSKFYWKLLKNYKLLELFNIKKGFWFNFFSFSEIRLYYFVFVCELKFDFFGICIIFYNLFFLFLVWFIIN